MLPGRLTATCTATSTANASIPNGAWDLVVCSYALNELREAQRAGFIRQAWARTGKLLVVIEPGTKTGFANILAVRTRLLAEGATLAAPCPNALACPMAGGDDWCHFAARVERTAEHRRLKNATLGHEDEKFSLRCVFAVAQARQRQAKHRVRARASCVIPGSSAATRSSRSAAKVRSPHTTVTRSKKEDWRRLKRLGWGDRW